MTAEYNTFAPRAFTAADFERADAETQSTGPMFAAPVSGRDPVGRPARSGMPAAAWIAVPVIALALGAGVYALNRPAPANPGVAQLTPGQASTPAPMETARTEPTAVTPTPATPAPSRMAAETPRAPASATRTAEVSPRVAAKVAPARHTASRAAPSAVDTGQNASASVQAPPAQAPAPVVITPPAPVVSATPPTAPQPAPSPETPPTTPPNS